MIANTRNQQGIALVSVVVIMSIVVMFAAAIFAVSFVNTRAEDETERTLVANFVAKAALNNALAEIVAQDDVDGDGLGALGTQSPVAYADGSGTVVAEYRTIVDTGTGTNVIVALAAVPNFTDPFVIRAVRAQVVGESEFPLRPNPAALSVSGPVVDPQFPGIGADDLIDGGDQAALVLSNPDAFDEFLGDFGDMVADGTLSGDELAGKLTSTYEHPSGDIELAILENPNAFLSAQELNDYRNELRTSVLDLAASADRTFTSSVTGDHTWGTAGSPEVVVIEAGAIGKDKVFDTDGQTITGHGTLIIKHTARPKKNLNLNWTGDIFVLGFDGDGSDLLYLYGTDAVINGNLILLSSDETEASLEITDGSRPSDVVVNGSLLCLAEASSHESEVEVEKNSSLTVNGMMGLYGSRIEIEASGSGTSLTVNGTLATGMAQDLDGSINRTDDFEFEMNGKVELTYDEDLLEAALDGLSELQANFNSPGDVAAYNKFFFSGVSYSGIDPATAKSLVESAIASGGDVGVDMDAIDKEIVEEGAQQPQSPFEG